MLLWGNVCGCVVCILRNRIQAMFISITLLAYGTLENWWNLNCSEEMPYNVKSAMFICSRMFWEHIRGKETVMNLSLIAMQLYWLDNGKRLVWLENRWEGFVGKNLNFLWTRRVKWIHCHNNLADNLRDPVDNTWTFRSFSIQTVYPTYISLFQSSFYFR